MIYLRTLLGKNNLDFSLSCLKSCIDNCEQQTTLEIFEDGSLTEELSEYIIDKIPNAVIVYKNNRDKQINHLLKDYSKSASFRQSNVFGFKLFDVMLYDPKPFFYLDSDIIFYRKFSFPQTGQHPVFMMDAENAYSFSNKEVYKKKKELFPRINAGFYFFPTASFNLDLVESMLNNHIKVDMYGHNWSEQSIWSFLAFKNKPAFYFNNKQVVMASPVIAVHKQIVAIHYSKPYRSKIQAVTKKINQLLHDVAPVTISIIPATTNVLFIPFLFRKYSNKVLRKLKRI